MSNWYDDMEKAEQEYEAEMQDEAYQQGRADTIDECKYNAELFREIFLEDLIQQSVDREEAMMYRNICAMAWDKYLKQLKEQTNE